MTRAPDWTVRPLVDGAGIPVEGRTSTFLAPWVSTLDLLARELEYLRASRAVLELDGILPGAPLAAVIPVSPRVRLSFESRFGPLSYATGRYTATPADLSWKHNVRAVALGLQALRGVDRWGITRGGEQYSGWLRLPAGEPGHSAGLLVSLSGLVGITATQVVADPGTFRRVYQAAARRLDPDTGGDLAAWHRLQRARTVLLDHHGESA